MVRTSCDGPIAIRYRSHKMHYLHTHQIPRCLDIRTHPYKQPHRAQSHTLQLVPPTRIVWGMRQQMCRDQFRSLPATIRGGLVHRVCFNACCALVLKRPRTLRVSWEPGGFSANIPDHAVPLIFEAVCIPAASCMEDGTGKRMPASKPGWGEGTC